MVINSPPLCHFDEFYGKAVNDPYSSFLMEALFIRSLLNHVHECNSLFNPLPDDKF